MPRFIAVLFILVASLFAADPADASAKLPPVGGRRR